MPLAGRWADGWASVVSFQLWQQKMQINLLPDTHAMRNFVHKPIIAQITIAHQNIPQWKPARSHCLTLQNLTYLCLRLFRCKLTLAAASDANRPKRSSCCLWQATVILHSSCRIATEAKQNCTNMHFTLWPQMDNNWQHSKVHISNDKSDSSEQTFHYLTVKTSDDLFHR